MTANPSDIDAFWWIEHKITPAYRRQYLEGEGSYRELDSDCYTTNSLMNHWRFMEPSYAEKLVLRYAQYIIKRGELTELLTRE